MKYGNQRVKILLLFYRGYIHIVHEQQPLKQNFINTASQRYKLSDSILFPDLRMVSRWNIMWKQGLYIQTSIEQDLLLNVRADQILDRFRKTLFIWSINIDEDRANLLIKVG